MKWTNCAELYDAIPSTSNNQDAVMTIANESCHDQTEQIILSGRLFCFDSPNAKDASERYTIRHSYPGTSETNTYYTALLAWRGREKCSSLDTWSREQDIE